MINEHIHVKPNNKKTEVEMFKYFLTSRPIDFSRFDHHPIKRVIESHEKNGEEYCLLLNELMSNYRHLFSGDVPFTVNVSINTNKNRMFSYRGDENQKLKQFKIPEPVLVDLVGFYLHNLNIAGIIVTDSWIKTKYFFHDCNIIENLLEHSICFKSKAVLNPVMALILNVAQCTGNYQQLSGILKLIDKIMEKLSGA